MNNTYIKILVVDNSPFYTHKIRQQLKSENLKQSNLPQYKIRTAATGLDGLLIANDFQPDCVLLDFSLPDMDKFEFLESLAEIREGVTVPALFMLESSAGSAVGALPKCGGYDCFVKGEFDELQLSWAIFCTLEQSKLEKQLYRKHQELELFADRMAHDLLVSLSKLSICAEYLEMQSETYADRMKDQKQLLGTMVESVDQTIGLVESFRTYARVDRMNVAFSNVNLNSIMDHILLLFESEIDELGAEIHIEPLPIIAGDPLGLGQLLQILVGNVIRYANKAPIIHIQAIKVDAMWQISIWASTRGDEQVSFSTHSGSNAGDAAHRMIPSTTQSYMGYPGTDIEHATCQRVVEQHGGELYFCSTSAEGMAIFFTLAEDLQTAIGCTCNNALGDIALSNHQYSAAVLKELKG